MKYKKVLKFWFRDGKDQKFWFKKDPALDAEIKKKFELDLKAAKKGKLESWAGTAQGRLALVILLDQFSRNIYRDTPDAFSADTQALELTLEGIEQGVDKELDSTERSFFYMPLMHAEDKNMQRKSVTLFSQLGESGKRSLKYAHLHKDIIDKFGRFPHRNKTLGRKSTKKELEFLQQPNSGF